MLAERLRIINKQAEVVAIESFYNARSAARLLPLDDPPSCVIDAIDNVAAKMHLMDRCRSHGIPLVSSMGAAGKLDPTAIEVADLYDSHTDPLARVLRKRLRGEYGWPGHDGTTSVKTGVTVVFSTESRRLPVAPSWDDEHGFQCICPHGDNGLHSCSQRNIIEGSAVFVTATFGMVASGEVVKRLVGSYAAPRIDEESQAGEVSCGQPGSATAANAMKA